MTTSYSFTNTKNSLQTWNEDLAEMAQEFANGCSGDHGQPDRDPITFDSIGQNIASDSVPITNMTDVVLRWYSEKKDYFYDDSACAIIDGCGHYTQVNSRFVLLNCKTGM